MRPTILSFGLMLAGLTPHAAIAARVVDIPQGDSQKLLAATRDAQQQPGKTVIRLRPGLYEFSAPLIDWHPAHDAIASEIVIEGSGATLLLRSADQRMIAHNKEDSLVLRDLTLTVKSPVAVNDSPRTFVVFSLRGHSYWENVAVTDSRVTTSTLAGMFSLGYQGSEPIFWRNVSVVGNKMYGRSAQTLDLLVAYGDLIRFESVTFADNLGYGDPAGTPVPLGIGADHAGSIRPSPPVVQNSLIESCRFAVNSLGGNAFLDSRCGAGAQDRLLSDAQLGSMDDHGGLVPTLALLPSSQAIGAGLPATCPATDARGFVRDAQRCDAGAYQFGAAGAGGKLDAGGANGTWIDLGGSGFLLVNRNTDEETLLVWLSYDRQRRQRWIYGVLNFADGQASGTAWNNDGPPSTGGYPDARVAGTFTATFISCEQTRLRFDSSSAELESFDRVLNRLSLVTQVGCSE
jgi:hypothetical protein